jgi:hypothetical protein
MALLSPVRYLGVGDMFATLEGRSGLMLAHEREDRSHSNSGRNLSIKLVVSYCPNFFWRAKFNGGASPMPAIEVCCGVRNADQRLEQVCGATPLVVYQL